MNKIVAVGAVAKQLAEGEPAEDADADTSCAHVWLTANVRSPRVVSTVTQAVENGGLGLGSSLDTQREPRRVSSATRAANAVWWLTGRG